MQYGTSDQTIIAQCTPQGSGAIALLRLSGEGVFAIADVMSKLIQGKKISAQPTHTIHYGWVVDCYGAKIDQVLFLVMHAPHTFTGDHTVEITCHNNTFIIQNIIQAALAAGARLAQEGEFSRRAVFNNKINIIQAEAINDLIHANTQRALKQSLQQLEGSFTQWVVMIEQQLIKALALSEASFEFLDEENMEFNLQIQEIIDEIVMTITRLKNTFDQQQQIRNGIRIAIIGSVNAGKSSLFNALLKQDRAIVTNIAGTTRDALEAGLYRNGNYWTLIDTAGLRVTCDVIERMGIQRSHQQACKADIILLVFDGSQKLTDFEHAAYQEFFNGYNDKIIIVVHKADLSQQGNILTLNKRIYATSATDERAIGMLEAAIQEKIGTLFQSIGSSFLLNQRHYNSLLSLEKKLIVILSMLTENISYELISYHLRDALTDLSELTGKSIDEAGMDAVFRQFCVGK